MIAAPELTVILAVAVVFFVLWAGTMPAANPEPADTSAKEANRVQ